MNDAFAKLAWICLAVSFFGASAYGQEEGRRRALVIGVNEYQNRKLADLSFAERDARELVVALKDCGFETDLLVGGFGPQAATRANVLNSLDLMLNRSSRKDIIVVAFAGHGITTTIDVGQGPTSCLCAYDSIPTRPESLISVREIIRRLEERGGAANLVLLDACRNDPEPGGRKAGVDAERMPPLGEGIAVFFACSPGQRAREAAKLAGGHGLFFRTVIEGIRGGASNNEQRVTWDRLAAYVKEQVPRRWMELFPHLPKNQVQTPHLVSNLASVVTFAERVAPRSFQESSRPETYANSIGMKFRLVPAGSSRWEVDAEIGKHFNLTPGVHTLEVKRPFYLGIYEVTRGQFLQFVRATGYESSARKNGGSNISIFDEKAKEMRHYAAEGGWSNVGFEQTDDHPVVCVTYFDAVEFCRWLSDKERRVYRLPTCQEWEFAYRADVKNGNPWGEHVDNIALLGNTCDSQMKEHLKDAKENHYNKLKDNFAFTAPVGSFKPNGWGFYDMIGNVNEWCSDDYETEFSKELRKEFPEKLKGVAFKAMAGGSWNDPYSRSWFRNPSECHMDNHATSTIGFRVVLESD